MNLSGRIACFAENAKLVWLALVNGGCNYCLIYLCISGSGCDGAHSVE